MVCMQDVSFGYKNEENTLHRVAVEIKRGECVLLCGESGCGKTTVTKLINGLVPHFYPECNLEGEVSVDTLAIPRSELYEIAKRVGSVFQNPKSQFFNLDTESELAFGLENAGVPRAQIRERIDETVQTLQIENLMGRNVFALSGGEKQTLAFASVYAMNPDVYVLDEPTANLDSEAIERLREQLLLLKQNGKTIVIAEHRLYFLLDMIDRAVYVEDGKIVKRYTAQEFREMQQEERERLALRAFTNEPVALPPARKPGEAQGCSVENLACGYEKNDAVFQGISFSVQPGEVLAITGTNGVGKTTLARCLCGLTKEHAGTISISGQRLSAKQRQKKAFCVMQDVNHQLFSDSVWGECEMAAGEGQDERITRVLSQLHLLKYKDCHPMALSGGQKQRVAVATAILSEKELIVFDEPTSGLDYRHMRQVTALVRELAARGKTIVVISHDREFLRAACDRALAL